MPTLSRCFLRGGLLCLALGMIPGGLILSQKGTGWFPVLWVLLPAHTYLVLIGGLSQCTLGVCYWIFPRFDGGASRGNTTLAWCSYAMLNAALGLVIVHPLLQLLYGDGAATVAFASAGTLQGLAALTFVWHIWPRICPSATVARRPG
jgi:cytochrome bd-type quinol oxidase subunit 2